MTSSQQPTLSTDNALPKLKGAPLAVLLALWRDGPAGRKELIRRTGWKKDAVSAALKRLVRLKLVVRHNHRRWGVTAGVSVPRLLGIVGIDVERPQEREKRAAQKAVGAGEGRKKPRSKRNEPGNGSAPAGGDGRKSRSYCGEERLDRRQARSGQDAGGRKKRSSWTAQGRPRRRSGRDSQESPQIGRHGQRAAPHARGDHDLIDDPQADPDLSEKPNNDHDQDEEGIIQSLQALNPPFDHARAWLQTVPPRLVAGWLAHLEAMPASQRGLIRNEAAFIRSRVRKGRRPPRRDPPSRKRSIRSVPAAPGASPAGETENSDTELTSRVQILDGCPRCGRPYFDSEGRCLVCRGVIKV